MNYFEMKLKAMSQNEKFARSTVASFAVSLNPTIDEINDIKTAVSEAVTNCVVHGYNCDENGDIFIKAVIENNTISIEIRDQGVGIGDVELALTPFYTTKPDEERSGMGFTLMQSFMDEMSVESQSGKGTTVVMKKTISQSGDGEDIDA